MVLKKNQIPPNLNFINPKPSLRLDERGIKVSPFLLGMETSINVRIFLVSNSIASPNRRYL